MVSKRRQAAAFAGQELPLRRLRRPTIKLQHTDFKRFSEWHGI
jgi:hypothetical protein